MAITWKKIAYQDDLDTHASQHAVSGSDTVFPADPAADKYLMWDDDPGELVWADAAGGTPSAHKDSHDPEDGSDALDADAAGEIVGVAAAAEGAAHSFARSDHTHQIQESMADNHVVTVNAADAAENDIARFSATGGLNGMTYAELAAAMALDDIGVPDAAVDFNLQQATDLVVMTVANEAALPGANVAVGQLCWATGELTLHICTVAA